MLIVTKARDNRLIKLTRELALYLMLKHRRGSKRGLVVCVISVDHCRSVSMFMPLAFDSYVDSQLRKSRRFDAEGIQRDHPELFEPFPRRRTSSSHSVSSISSASVHNEESDEGQLRYWTSSMCNHSPHLFDFVVTVRIAYACIMLQHRTDNPNSSEAMAQSFSHPGSSSASYRPSSHSPWALSDS